MPSAGELTSLKLSPIRRPASTPWRRTGLQRTAGARLRRRVLAHDDLSHFGSAPRWSSGNQTLAARPASPPCLAEQPVSFAGPPGVILDGFDEVFVDEHGLLLLLVGVVSYRRRRRRGWKESVRCSLISFLT